MNALEIHKLDKIYSNGLHALKGIDLSIKEGDFFALLGPNGAGKSTTIGIITSLVNKSSGNISVFGLDLDRYLTKVKSYLGFVPQEINFSLFETCLDILLNQAGYYGIKRSIAMLRAEKYLRELDLWDRRHDISRTLSGGLKRRLMIARSLINEPKMLILDEPTAGVDVELRRSMWDFLVNINRNGTTILLTTHYLEEAENLCKNIAIIDKGKIVVDTTMKQLLSKLTIQTFVLDLESDFKQFPSIDDFTFRLIDPHTVEVAITKEQNLNDLFRILSEHKIRIHSMRNKSNRLEELFINLLKNKLN